MKRILFIVLLISSTVSGFTQYPNVTISNVNTPEEPSIVISTKNPAIQVAGANLSGYYYSSDYGNTWTPNYLTSLYGIWGDPLHHC